MRILCAECFNQIVNIKKGIAVCSYCGAEYNISEKSSQFKVHLNGGFIKTKLSYDDIVLGIKTGSILAGDYIASIDGPWIHVYDSSFEYYFKKIDEQDNRSGIILYKKKKKKISIINMLILLLIISIAVNWTLIILLYMMNNRIIDLVSQITGG